MQESIRIRQFRRFTGLEGTVSGIVFETIFRVCESYYQRVIDSVKRIRARRNFKFEISDLRKGEAKTSAEKKRCLWSIVHIGSKAAASRRTPRASPRHSMGRRKLIKRRGASFSQRIERVRPTRWIGEINSREKRGVRYYGASNNLRRSWVEL